jgi:nicotinamidase-related amidase
MTEENDMARDDRRVTYPIDPATTALVSVDFQVGFGRDSWEPVPHADAAVRNFIRAAQAWREIGGTVIHVHIAYTPERGPTGRMTDFISDIAGALAKDSPATVFYDGLIQDGDILVPKTTFSAVISSDLLAQLQSRHFDTAVVGGLTTPICVQTTVDGLSMSGIKVVLLEDACASQAIGRFSAEQAHQAAVDRMGYLFAQIETTAGFIASAKAAARQLKAAS